MATIRSKNPNTTPLRIPEKSQEALIKYFNNAALFLNNNYNLREQLLARDRSYYRETDKSLQQMRAQLANNVGDPKALQNITIPVVYPQVESTLAYLTDIFLSGYPIFPVLAKKELGKEALQLETIIGEHSVRYGWVSQLMMALRDGLKYNLMAVECSWKNDKTWTVETDTGSTSGASTAVETYYQGNVLKRLNPYNLILDTRIENPCEMHIKGEFNGYTELKNRVELKQLFQDLGAENTMNARAAFESGSGTYTSSLGTANYYIPEINPAALKQKQDLTTTNWHAWAEVENKDSIKYADMYEVSVLYCRIIPIDFALNVASRGTVQIWKLIVVNRQILIYAERQTNAHNNLGIIVGQPIEDGLGWQTKSFAENAAPMQAAASSLFNSGLESQRRKVYDRILYDPSRVNKSDIDKVSPVARIPVRQSAYGTNLNEAVHVVPFRDDGVGEILQMSQQVAAYGDIVNGVNKVQQGQFQKGNKSRREFDTVMGNANGRNQTMAIGMEYRFFQPLKEIIKLNILQFQPPETLYNRNTKEPVEINPVDIRKASLEFRIADGVLPVDKMINLEAFGTVMQMTAANPAMGADFDMVGMFMYTLQMSGASWVMDFKRTPEEKLAYMQNLQATSGATDAAGNPIAPTPT